MLSSVFVSHKLQANKDSDKIGVSSLPLIQLDKPIVRFSPNNTYQWIWEEYQGASGDIQTEDIVFWGEEMGPYHNYDELTAKLYSLEAHFPELVDLFSIGHSTQGRELWVVKLTNETASSAKVEFYVVGAHHAREAITVENCLYFIDKLINGTLEGNTTFEQLLEKTEIYVIPLLNPDGHSILWWYPWMRKNMRKSDDDFDRTYIDEFEVKEVWDQATNRSVTIAEDSEDPDTEIGEDGPGGVDLNRNYDFQWYGSGSSSQRSSFVYRGPMPDSEPETQAMIEFAWEHDFRYALSLHSGVEAIIIPWGYTNENPPHYTELNDTMYKIKEITAIPTWEEIGGYNVNGEWGDWMLARRDILPFTFETYGNPMSPYIWDAFNPPADEVIQRSDNIFNGTLFLALNPHLTQTNNLPSISSPSFNFIDEQHLNISWFSSDLDSQQLYYSIYYGKNNRWINVARNITESYFVLDISSIPNNDYIFRLSVTDGIDRVVISSQSISLNYLNEGILTSELIDNQTAIQITLQDDDINYNWTKIENTTVYASSVSTGTDFAIELSETTVSSGTFAGTLGLTLNPSKKNESLYVSNFDTVTIIYYDNTTTSGNKTIFISLAIEFNQPIVSEFNGFNASFLSTLFVSLILSLWIRRKERRKKLS
ncbi:MAG: M14 family zinc carboxypeptidase [Candidatus Heimdallarchaeaceae archaeon]